jgi:pyruvate-formate lyase-activating enzyme
MMDAETVMSPSSPLPAGTVFHVQRTSFHDGPGVRSTVFLKGCPLRYPWCHNPESLAFGPEVFLQRERCLQCGACAEVCPRAGARIGCGVVRSRPARSVDGQTLALQTEGVQAAFRAVWGDLADEQWVLQHNRALGGTQ